MFVLLQLYTVESARASGLYAAELANKEQHIWLLFRSSLVIFGFDKPIHGSADALQMRLVTLVNA